MLPSQLANNAMYITPAVQPLLMTPATLKAGTLQTGNTSSATPGAAVRPLGRRCSQKVKGGYEAWGAVRPCSLSRQMGA